jgi:hypothetical protein
MQDPKPSGKSDPKLEKIIPDQQQHEGGKGGLRIGIVQVTIYGWLQFLVS